MMWYGWGSGSWVSWVLMSLSFLVFWGGLIALIVWAIRRTEPGSRGEAGPPGSDGQRPDPLSILEERFARGEIDAEELEARRSVLQKH